MLILSQKYTESLFFRPMMFLRASILNTFYDNFIMHLLPVFVNWKDKHNKYIICVPKKRFIYCPIFNKKYLWKGFKLHFVFVSFESWFTRTTCFSVILWLAALRFYASRLNSLNLIIVRFSAQLVTSKYMLENLSTKKNIVFESIRLY